MTRRPRPREECILGAEDILKNVKIKIDGRRIGGQDAIPSHEDVAMNENSHPSAVSSQSVLLDGDSFGPNNRTNSENTPRSKNNGARSTRSTSRLSMLSLDPQLDYLSEIPFMTELQDDGNGFLHRDLSDSLDWASGERLLAPRQSKDSDSVIPQPELPVRGRFAIDEQAIADSQGFMLSSPVAEPSITQLLHGQLGHGESPEACMSSSLGSSSKTGSVVSGHGQRVKDNIFKSQASRSIYPQFGWLPQAHRQRRARNLEPYQPILEEQQRGSTVSRECIWSTSRIRGPQCCGWLREKTVRTAY
ncbi:hypothetical protein BDW71DRAFT_16114 [Aspergillus fruticulosus]